MKKKTTYKIIVEYYPYEILAYCPQIPYYHQMYDTDCPINQILQEAKEEIDKLKRKPKPLKKIITTLPLLRIYTKKE